MSFFAIFYDYPADSHLIAENRPVHREFLAKLKEEGILVGSGPFLDENGGALIIIRLNENATVADAEQLMNADPFHRLGILAGRVIRKWNPVLNIFS
ncbi:YciI family protein [Corynebacterium epidermidicanis]|uniref:YCII-related domain-containing protein n=1 Tax=Corynebacterium epidermidicanis TaxID=1050174 RepID=A0A0G3GWX9_9CORY|nr:YciI family protein [Corynebacterium epidermidicanis]AKK03357.1 hypothetical protein CEPID_07530 [Corynebacterium epidermidicanis]